MSAVLGVSCGYHDAAAALVVDGVIAAAMQEERFSRIKNDPRLPAQAIAACLRLAGVKAGDLDRVVFYEDPFAKLERVMKATLHTWPRSWRQFPRAVASQFGEKLGVLDALAKTVGVARSRVEFVDHHTSHAASAFLCSPYERAAVLTVDGVGETATTALWRGVGSHLERLATLDFPHSLGLLYAAITAWLGFDVNEGESKVMGLAAFGRPVRREAFAKLVDVAADGSFTLDASYLGDLADPELGFGPKLEVLLGPRRPAGVWDLAGSVDQAYADAAATLQQVTEEVLLGLAREVRRRTGEDALCLAGGVALNAVANARLARESGFSSVFVQPAAGDAGGALGAALYGGRARLTSAALGCAVDVARTVALATGLGLRCSPCAPDEEAAARIARGEVVAFVSGRFEWGPRALGHRSLLADPARAASRERLNAVVKRRELFRPFAPAVAAASCEAWFEGPPDAMTPYMTTVRRVRSDGLPAVTHVDRTARVQTVEDGPLAGVLRALDARTRVPVVLNTSLNGKGEPIVASGADALSFFTTHDIDALIVEDRLICR